MKNIPTDLLRTFVSVVELRSFTRAAKAQGMTQPAVSAQIRRLQFLLGSELFDKSAPGVSLTPVGQSVIESARRLLSVNDHIVQIVSPNSASQLVRIGVRKDCMGEELAGILAVARARWPHLRLTAYGAGQRRMLQRLKDDQLDLVVALVPDEPAGAARHYWTEELAWSRGKTTVLDLNARSLLTATDASVTGPRWQRFTKQASRANWFSVPIPPRRCAALLPQVSVSCSSRAAVSRPNCMCGMTVRCRRRRRSMAAFLFARGRQTRRSNCSRTGLRRRSALLRRSRCRRCKRPPRRAPATLHNRLPVSQADSA
jgi:DNA-binding transcriptional LysR family regulator